MKRGGAKLGHIGSGQKSASLDRVDKVIVLPMKPKCEGCDLELKLKDSRERTIIESVPVIAKEVIYQCPRGTCPKCKKTYASNPPVMSKCLYGNSLVSQAAVLHYVHGITMGKALNIFTYYDFLIDEFLPLLLRHDRVLILEILPRTWLQVKPWGDASVDLKM